MYIFSGLNKNMVLPIYRIDSISVFLINKVLVYMHHVILVAGYIFIVVFNQELFKWRI